MLRPDQKASAQLAWQNFVSQNPDKTRGLTEEAFVNLVEELERSLKSGLIDPKDYDARLTSMLRSPDTALDVTTYTPPRQTTDKLLAELKDLHKRGILTDDEFEERKGELFYERNVTIDPDQPIPPGEVALERKVKLKGYLEELLAAGVLDHAVVDTAKVRIENL